MMLFAGRGRRWLIWRGGGFLETLRLLLTTSSTSQLPFFYIQACSFSFSDLFLEKLQFYKRFYIYLFYNMFRGLASCFTSRGCISSRGILMVAPHPDCGGRHQPRVHQARLLHVSPTTLSIWNQIEKHTVHSFTLYVTAKGTPHGKEILSGIARMRGGRPLPELKNTIYIFIFDGRKRCTSCPKEGQG